MQQTQEPVLYDTDIPLTSIGLRLPDRIKLGFLYLKAAILIPIGILRGLRDGFLYILSLYRTIFYIALITFIWYMLVLYWPYFMLVIINVLIPIANVLILLFNLFSMVALIILRLLIMMWNIFVPFIGIFLMVVVNLFFTIIGDVFDAIGSGSFEPVVGAFIQIISVLVDIFMKVIGIIIKIGTPILIQFSKIVTTLVEVIMMAVKILLPIVMWIVDSLFKLLEPILDVVSWYFGGIAAIFGMSASSMATGRSLLNLKVTPNVFNMTGDNLAYDPYIESKKLPNDGYMQGIFKKHYGDLDDIALPESNSFDSFASSNTGRKILEKWADDNPFDGKKLRFKEEEKEGEEEENGNRDPDRPSDKTLSDYSNQMAYTFYNSAKRFGQEDLKMANGLMREVLNENNHRENMALRAIFKEYKEKHEHLEVPFEHTLSNVKIRGVPEHPEDMRKRFKQERKHVVSVLHKGYSGRELLETDFDKNKDLLLSQRRIDDAKTIAAQEAKYREHEITRMKFVTVVYNSASKSLKDNIENIVSPGDLIAHWDDTLRYFGYQSLNEVREEFVNTHVDGAGFVESLSWIGEHPIFNLFARDKDEETVLPDNIRFLNWAEEQRALREARAFALNGTKASGRSLLEVVQQNQDVNVAGSKESKESFGAFPMISTRNCFSNPKNKMCIPQIPASVRPRINTIKLTADQKRALTTYVIYCTPWYTTFALIDIYRLVNVLQELRFFISAIPFFNRNIATLTNLAPWTGVLFNWIFLVPKYQNATLFQWVCWFNHLFDIWIWGVALWIALKIFSLLRPMAVDFWNNVTAVRLNESVLAPFYQRRQARLERIFAKGLDRGQIVAREGDTVSPLGTQISAVVRDQNLSIGAVINGDTHHHHHHYHTNDSPAMSSHIKDPEIRNEAYERELVELYSELHEVEGKDMSIRLRIAWYLNKIQNTLVQLDPHDIDHKNLAHSKALIDSHPVHEILSRRIKAPQRPSSSSNPNFDPESDIIDMNI